MTHGGAAAGLRTPSEQEKMTLLLAAACIQQPWQPPPAQEAGLSSTRQRPDQHGRPLAPIVPTPRPPDAAAAIAPPTYTAPLHANTHTHSWWLSRPDDPTSTDTSRACDAIKAKAVSPCQSRPQPSPTCMHACRSSQARRAWAPTGAPATSGRQSQTGT